MLICGTIPWEDFSLSMGAVKFSGKSLIFNDREIPCLQGTAALIGAACVTAEYLEEKPPQALLVGDRGTGKGSRLLYEYLSKNLPTLVPDVLVLHYILPVMGLMRKVCESAERCRQKPVMIADASSMYAAKAAGLAQRFDIFTPDACEMAFLADPDATHPAYISRHLFDSDITKTPELVAKAYQNGSATRLLLVKGSIDYIVKEGKILETISAPDIPSLEAIGGTGDTITGMVAAFASAGLELHEAAILAARANRTAGEYAQATPATRIWEIIAQFPAVFREYLCARSGVCYAVRDGGL
ncbi:MAG: NAD(P)H-hydrate dehydratase [Syntrophales bacterium]|nr:NAD(P)H-hydrate dehydratase [Syntrophales bacterium]